MPLLFMLAPAHIFAHEFGHFAVARLHGYEADLHLSFVRLIYPSSAEAKGWPEFWVTLAGPLVNFTTAVIGTILLCLGFRSDEQYLRSPVTFWLLSFLAITGLRGIRVLLKPGASDEESLFVWLGAEWLLPVAMLVMTLLFVILIVRIHWRCGTLLPLAGGIVIATVSTSMFVRYLGPICLIDN